MVVVRTGWPKKKECLVLYGNGLWYPLCMLTIQLPSEMLTGPPPTILILLWITHLTEDSSPAKTETHKHWQTWSRYLTRLTWNGKNMSPQARTYGICEWHSVYEAIIHKNMTSYANDVWCVGWYIYERCHHDDIISRIVYHNRGT